jgi:hypothetical protein
LTLITEGIIRSTIGCRATIPAALFRFCRQRSCYVHRRVQFMSCDTDPDPIGPASVPAKLRACQFAAIKDRSVHARSLS